MSTSPVVPAGWYQNEGKAQYWDGHQWLEAAPSQKERDAQNPYQKFLFGGSIVLFAVGVIMMLFARGEATTATVYGDSAGAAYVVMLIGALLIVAAIIFFVMWIGVRARR